MNKQFHLAIKNTEGVVEFEKTFDTWPERRAPAPIQENRQPVRTTWGVGFRAFTLEEAARCLRRAGAKNVQAICVARTH